ncbi:MAG: class I SAM-dependent methyltransferase [Alphaproteobacteria bacterium]|nr:class I SAM-dependent methyltransferase [Alphaproteobacteria bacterium]
MNPGIPDDDPSIEFYDSDYPSTLYSPHPENLDAKVASQMIAHDLDRYRALAKAAQGPVLELCCGTGRIAIPLAADGHEVVGVDVSAGQLARCRANLARVPAAAGKLELVEADVATLDLGRRDFALVILAFNSLICMPDFLMQRRALFAAARHLAPDGVLAVDCTNPLTVDPAGDATPRLLLTRRHADTGRTYQRFIMIGPMDPNQMQAITGWYDEIADDGLVRRKPYAMKVRPIYRFELQLMIEATGMAIARIHGGHRGEPFHRASPIMFVEARHRQPRG